MSIRGKTILIIMVIVLVITSFTLGIGLVISQHRFLSTIEATLLSVSKITSGMVSAEINELQNEAQLIAEELRIARPSDLQRTLNQQIVQTKHYFPNLSVIGPDNTGRDRLLATAGIAEAHPSLRRDDQYGKRAFAGETLISTTRYTPERELEMQIWTPIDENRVLVATLPGLHLSEFLSPYHMWETGSIFIVDGEGVFIATNQQTVRVLERLNYIEWGKRSPEYQTTGLAFQNFVANDEGITNYYLSGIKWLCAYDTIADTDNWTVVVTASLNETPISQMRQILLVCSLIVLALGIAASLVASNSIAAPYEKMETLRKAAEAASETKSRFLANVSHEMRTPLNAIIGISEMELGSSNLEGNILSNMEKINAAGTTLMNIINDLLDISKIESGKFALVPVVYDVPALISDVINLNIVRIGSKKIDFHLHVKGDLPVKLKGDELRVKQIFNNLLSNAFKYTSAGAVDWTINCKREGEQIKLTSSILDTGSGISPEDMDKLFKDYSQTDRKSNYYVQGTGLGLSITKNLVDRMGGSISVQSEPRKGSCFTVEVLQELVNNDCIGEEAARKLSELRYVDQNPSGKKKLLRLDMSYANVLVVDDVFANLDVARGMLKPYKINVDCVTSGQEAIKRVREEKIRYDAIFMDHLMPEMDGIEATKIIRSEIGTDYAKKVPIIALTANAMQGNDSLFLENGFQAFLSKPIDILRLDAILNQWVRDKSKETSTEPIAVVPASRSMGIFANATIPGLDIATGFDRFGNDEAAYMDILAFFVLHTAEFIETIRPGIIADKIDDYRIAIHGMKGSSRSIGADQLGDEAEKLEYAAKSGDVDYVEANNSVFIEHAEKLIAGIKAFTESIPPHRTA